MSANQLVVLGLFLVGTCPQLSWADSLEDVADAVIATRDAFFAGKVVAHVKSASSAEETWEYRFGPAGSLSVSHDSVGAKKSYALDGNGEEATELVVPAAAAQGTVTVYDQKGIFAARRPSSPQRPDDKIPWVLMRSVRRSMVGDHYPLEDFFSWKDTRVQQASDRGIVVSSIFPDSTNDDDPKNPDTIQIVVSPQEGFAIVSVAIRDFFKNNEYPVLEYLLEASEHQEAEPGLWLPTKVKLSVREGGKSIPMGWTADLTYEDINVVPDESELRVSPPENALMWIYEGGGDHSAVLYGADGQIVKTFNSKEDVSKYRKEAAEASGAFELNPPRRSMSWFVFGMVNLLALAVLIGFNLFRRVARKGIG